MTNWRETVLAFSALAEPGKLLLTGRPAWIWSRDGDRLLWANVAGGARFGAARFVDLAARRWPAGHPLRREIVSLSRSVPPQGTAARLRALDDFGAMPLTCRCRILRAGNERGLFAEALDSAAPPTTAAELVAFFAADGGGAVLFDESDRELAASGPPIDPILRACGPHAEFTAGGEIRRLYIGARPPSPPEPAVEATATDADAAPVEPPFRPTEETAAVASPPAPPEASAPRRVLTVTKPLPASPPLLLSTPPAPVSNASDGDAPSQPEGDAAKPAAGLATDQATAPPQRTTIPEPPAPRSIVAGRVPRELSRKPVRFLWQTDGADRFLFVSPGLAQVVGRNAEIVGESLQDAAARLRLDPTERIKRAVAQRDTWSGQTAWWPIEGSNVRVPAELTALPVFGGDHSFQGFRGFGVLRPAEALMPAAFEARFGRATPHEGRSVEQTPPDEEAVAAAPANVVPIRADLDRPDQARLSPQERSAFEEIAAALRDRVVEAPDPRSDDTPARAAAVPPEPGARDVDPSVAPSAAVEPPAWPSPTSAESAASGRSEAQPVEDQPAADEAAAPALEAPDGRSAERAAEPVHAPPPIAETSALEQAEAPEKTGRPPPAEAEAQRRLREMTAILDTATDGVVILDAAGIVESVNGSAEALFGLDGQDMQGTPFGALLTPESRAAAADYLAGLRDNGVASLLNEGREIEARAGPGTIPLFMTMGRISGDDGGRFCAVLRDITHWKRTEAELVAARRAAETASSQKSEFLARVSHEIRTPLNAIIGFAEVMIEERFGPVENERYRDYLRDIRTSGEHVVSLVNDLLDISKIEAGKLELTFVAVPLNDLVRECIGLMQPQAGRAHVVLRTSLSREVPAIVADHRTIRQIVLNLLSNSVKFTGPGGQVIASTSLAGSGEALLRIRDTGEGMSEAELARALEPFRQIATAPLADRSGTGLGLPLTKALVEANRASLAIRSARGEGTVVTVTFPPTRVLSE